MALPEALTGLRAIGVPGSTSSTAFAIVTGGYDGTANSNVTYSINLNLDGTVGSTTNISWTTIPANSLPETRAHHAIAEAAQTPRFLFLGGQAFTGTSGPGGALSSTVYVNSAP
jgi:hypothetical protein